MKEKIPQNNVPQPVLTPESMAQHSASSSGQERIKPDPKAKKKAGSKETGIGMNILFASILVLLAGGVVFALLAANGTFSKGKRRAPEEETTAVEPTTKESEEKSEGETTKESAGESKVTTYSTDSASDSQTGAFAQSFQDVKLVSAVSQMTPEEQEKICVALQEYIQNAVMIDGANSNDPSKVVFDEINCLGMTLQEEEIELDLNKTGKRTSITFVYQVQVTDNVGASPVKRQYFSSVTLFRFQNKDISTTDLNSDYGRDLSFDGWSTDGFLNLDDLIDDIEFDGEIKESTIDQNRLLPFDGKDPSEFEIYKPVTSFDQISENMRNKMKRNSETVIKSLRSFREEPAGKILENYEFLGFAFTVSEDGKENVTYTVYKFTFRDLDKTPPEAYDFYWYVGFHDSVEGGQTDRSCSYVGADPWDLENWAGDPIPTNLDDVRKAIADWEPTWKYEDNLSE